MELEELCMNCFKIKGQFSVCPFCGWADGTIPEQAYHLHPGTVLQNRYIVGVVIGFGGFGVTYKCWDNNLGKIVAVKEFYPAGLVNRVPGEAQVVVFSGDKKDQYRQHLERFLDEARTMAKFENHANIVSVYNFFLENETGYIAMEYLEGQTLKEYLDKSGGKLDLDNALEIINPVIEALSAMHQKGVIHRDIHPSNIYLNNDGFVKLLDLGAARLSTGDKDETRSVVITPGYASPEQYRSKSKQGPWTDVYGTGAVLYKLVTGVVPEESIDRIASDLLMKPGSINPLVKGNLDKAIMKAMSVKPELRFQTVLQFREALFQNKNVKYPEEELKARVRNRIIISVCSVLAVIAAVTLSFLIRPVPMFSYTEGGISVLYVTESTYSDENMKVMSVYGELTDQFEKEYPGTAINMELAVLGDGRDISSLPLDRYSLVISESGLLSSGVFEPARAFYDTLFEKTGASEYMFLEDYIRDNPDGVRIPLGFSVLCVYENATLPASENAVTQMTERSGVMCHTLDSLAADDSFLIGRNGFLGVVRAMNSYYEVEETNYEIMDDSYFIYTKELFDDIRDDAEIAPISLFAGDAAEYYLGDITEYRRIQTLLPGYYKVAPFFDDNAVPGFFTESAAVNANATPNEKNISMLFVSFLLRNPSQNYLHVQNNMSIPVSALAFDTFITSNSELSFIKSLTEGGVVMPAHDRDERIVRFSRDYYRFVILDFTGDMPVYDRFLMDYDY